MAINLKDEKGFSGIVALTIIAGVHHISVDPYQIVRALGVEGSNIADPEILRAARELQLQASIKKISAKRLPRLNAPYILALSDGHYCTVLRNAGNMAAVVLPGTKQLQSIPFEKLAEFYAGRVLLIKQPLSLSEKPRPHFDIAWFIPFVWKFRKVLGEILIAALALQLLALAFPMFSQVIIDKVLTHRSVSTLHVLAFGMLAIFLFEGIMGVLKALLLSHTTNRIDVMVSSRIFNHLLRIPLRYFEVRQVGQTVARIREVDQIRQFLTGQAMMAVLDALFVIIFIGILLFYNVTLTFVTLAMLGLFVLLSVVIRPIMRSQVEVLFEHNAKNQSFLVEVVTGIQTVKSLALEPQLSRRWEFLTARYIALSSRLQKLGGVASAIGTALQHLTTLAILWVGAFQVMENKLSVGQLIAFQMISGQVTGPFMRIVQLWQDFQRVGISIDRLGDLMNTHAEPSLAQNKPTLPSLRGNISFERVTFRYSPETPPVLKSFSLNIAAGTSVGIVGRSGSGKSTLAKLLDRLYSPEGGHIMVDDLDIAQTDPLWLRRQIGFVMQENFLFSGSIQENIAIQMPHAPMEDIIRAAQLAGAHEFISSLPQGYNTEVGERGTALSGGQRQRIAIARILLADPRVLVFDEATSALDNESARIIKRNLKKICAGRSVLIIAHRLSTVVSCDQIIVMKEGEIIEQGSHAELMEKKGAYYHLAVAEDEEEKENHDNLLSISSPDDNNSVPFVGS